MLKPLNPDPPSRPQKTDVSGHRAAAQAQKKIKNLVILTDFDAANKKNRRNAVDSFHLASDSSSPSRSNSLNSTISSSSTKSSASAHSVTSTNSSRQGLCSLRNVSADDVRKVLTRLGFIDRSQKGSHHNLVSPNTHRSVTVPDHGSSHHPMAAGTVNSILNEVQDILEQEIAVLPKSGSSFFIGKDEIRAWVSDPKGCRQEIKALGQRLARLIV